MCARRTPFWLNYLFESTFRHACCFARADLRVLVDAAVGVTNPLANSDEYLLQISKIHKFAQRVECWSFRSAFAENILDLKEKVAALSAATKAIKESNYVRQILGVVLSVGNHMNGGTARGQADGFHLEMLAKLRDIKTVQFRVVVNVVFIRMLCQPR